MLFSGLGFAVAILYFMSVNIWAIKLKYQNYFMEVLWLYTGFGFVVILPNHVYRAQRRAGQSRAEQSRAEQSRAEPTVHAITATWKFCEDILSHPHV
jgi:hypothetical protein